MTETDKVALLVQIKRERTDWTFLLDEITDLQKKVENQAEIILSFKAAPLTFCQSAKIQEAINLIKLIRRGDDETDHLVSLAVAKLSLVKSGVSPGWVS